MAGIAQYYTLNSTATDDVIELKSNAVRYKLSENFYIFLKQKGTILDGQFRLSNNIFKFKKWKLVAS
jgi:hypothetical protein